MWKRLAVRCLLAWCLLTDTLCLLDSPLPWSGLERLCCRELLVGGLPLSVDRAGPREKVEGKREWEIVEKSP